MNNSAFASLLSGTKPAPSRHPAFVEALSGSPKPSGAASFAKAFLHKPLDRVDELHMQLAEVEGMLAQPWRIPETSSPMGKMLAEVVQEQVKKLRRSREGAFDIPTVRDKQGNVKKKSAPSIYDDLEALILKLQIQREREAGMHKGKASESASNHRLDGRQVRLAESCTLESRSTCSCRRCLAAH